MQKKTEFSLEEAAIQFLEYRAKKALVERKLEQLKFFLKPIIKKAPGKQIVIQQHLFEFEEYPQEFFKLKDAKKKIPLKVLKPFITSTNVEKIRTKFIGDNEELAAA